MIETHCRSWGWSREHPSIIMRKNIASAKSVHRVKTTDANSEAWPRPLFIACRYDFFAPFVFSKPFPTADTCGLHGKK